ncbi:MAG: 3-mercaptopyruvate sulfurtransferase [Aestuariivirgaceae bacterium]|nr:3-mercaptopyruvate sulfurtransferase [Aestuariivirgaceae bacterium]
MNWLVSTEWLAAHLDAPDIAIVDASWHLPNVSRDAHAEYVAARIPGAVFFDIDEIADTTSPFPHMLPSPEKFSSRMRKMGIGDGKRVVVYDSYGLFSAARVWWMLRVFGKEDVAVLDGGLKKWNAEGRPLEDGPPIKPQERHFTARFNSLMVRDKAEMQKALAGGMQVADARGAGRFTGAEPEPRPGLRGGHMPGARNVHYAKLLNEDGTLKAPDALRSIFAEAGIDPAKPVITSCGSGVTAAVLSLGLAEIGNQKTALYDGSWTEWGSDTDLPAVTGEA